MIRIDDSIIDTLIAQARQSKRKRQIFNFHPSSDSLIQRMLNAMEPETYIQPHKHELPDKTEVFFCLRGRILVVEYTNQGEIADHIVLDAATGNYGCEIAAGRWHSIISLQTGSVAYEVKDGPYDPKTDKKFASWAPGEDESEAGMFNTKILQQLGLS